EAEAFPGAVIDQGEDAEAPTAHQRVHDEVEPPAQVPVLRDRHRRPRAQSPFAAATHAHGQPLFLVEPVELLRAEPDALALQHQAETAIAEPTALCGELAQLGPQPFIASPLRGIAIGLRVQPDEPTGPPLRIASL